MEYCSKCGAEIPEGSKFCPKCGQPVEYAERVYEPEVQERVRPSARPRPGSGEYVNASGAITVGVLGLVMALCIPLVGCILGIIAIAMGSSASSRGATNGGTAVALGVIALILAIVAWAITFALLSTYL